MLKGCAIFYASWFLQTILLLPLTPLIFGLLTFFAMMEYTPLEQIQVRATIHTALNQLQTIHMAFYRTV
jgi:hypothetical protein